MWKKGEELQYRVDDPSPSSAPNSVVAAAVPNRGAVAAFPVDAAVPNRSAAVAAFPVSAAAAPKQRLCSKCQKPGHQANSKKCSMSTANDNSMELDDGI